LPQIERAEAFVGAYRGPTPALLAWVATNFAERVATTRLAAIPKLVMAEAGNFPDLARFYLREVIERGFRLIGGILRRGIARGEFREVDVEAAVRCTIAPFLLLILWKTTFEPHAAEPLDASRLVRGHLDLLLRGLGATPDAAKEAQDEHDR
jgi:Tetracyclin repressor-like, C-terminal domain